jgi:hypothetical protein
MLDLALRNAPNGRTRFHSGGRPDDPDKLIGLQWARVLASLKIKERTLSAPLL